MSDMPVVVTGCATEFTVPTGEGCFKPPCVDKAARCAGGVCVNAELGALIPIHTAGTELVGDGPLLGLLDSEIALHGYEGANRMHRFGGAW